MNWILWEAHFTETRFWFLQLNVSTLILSMYANMKFFLCEMSREIEKMYDATCWCTQNCRKRNIWAYSWFYEFLIWVTSAWIPQKCQRWTKPQHEVFQRIRRMEFYCFILIKLLRWLSHYPSMNNAQVWVDFEISNDSLRLQWRRAHRTLKISYVVFYPQFNLSIYP